MVKFPSASCVFVGVPIKKSQRPRQTTASPWEVEEILSTSLVFSHHQDVYMAYSCGFGGKCAVYLFILYAVPIYTYINKLNIYIYIHIHIRYMKLMHCMMSHAILYVDL